MDKLLEMIIASGISLGVFGVIALILWVVFIKKYITDLETKLAARNAETFERIKIEISDKASRARVLKLEEEVTEIRAVGLNAVWRDNLAASIAGIFDRLNKMSESVAKIQPFADQLNRVERKLDRHIENDK